MWKMKAMDKSLLVTYDNHVARQLQNGVVSNNVVMQLEHFVCYLVKLNSKMIFIRYCRIVVNLKWFLIGER